jgi:hypothetical protein
MIHKVFAGPSGLAHYAAFTATFTVAAAPSDVFHITGSATKIVKVLKMFYSPIQTTAGIDIISIRKRNTANTGGTAVATTRVPFDSNDPAATATVEHYTANPTVGNSVGNYFMGKIDSPQSTTTSMGGLICSIFDFSVIWGAPLILRGTAEQATICHDTAGLPAGLAVHAGAIWTEE